MPTPSVRNASAHSLPSPSSTSLRGLRSRRRPRRGPRGFGQAAPVDLAVGQPREGRQHDDGRGDHVVGQGAGDLGAHGGGVRRGRAGRGDVGDEPLVAGGALLGDDDGLGDVVEPGDVRLHLPELHAEAADLDLGVGAAEEFDGAVLPAAGEVAGVVEHRVRVAGQEVGVELRGGELGAAVVAGRDPGAGDVQAADLALGHGAAVLVQEVDAEVCDGHADRDLAVGPDLVGGGPAGEVDAGPEVEAGQDVGGLGGAVGHHDLERGVDGRPAVDALGRGHQDPQRRVRGPVQAPRGLGQGGHQHGVGDALADDPVADLLGALGLSGLGDVDGRTGGQVGEPLHDLDGEAGVDIQEARSPGRTP